MTFFELKTIMEEKKFSDNATILIEDGCGEPVIVNKWQFLIDKEGQYLVLIAE